MFARNVAPGVWRLPFDSSTLPPFDHTNGWLIADGASAVLIDPGFRDVSGLEMLQDTLRAADVAHLEAVWLTHTHNDHCEGLGRVRGAHPEARVFVHQREISRLDVADRVYAVADAGVLTVGGREVRALHTPGHSPGHLAFVLDDVGWTFVGDLLAGRGSVWVGAPEGDVAAYLASLERVWAAGAQVLAPGHGDPLMEPEAAIAWAREHRLQREAQVLAALRAAPGPVTVQALRAEVYPELEPGLGALAERSLVAHLRKLVAEGRAARIGDEPWGPYRAVN